MLVVQLKESQSVRIGSEEDPLRVVLEQINSRTIRIRCELVACGLAWVQSLHDGQLVRIEYRGRRIDLGVKRLRDSAAYLGVEAPREVPIVRSEVDGR